MANIFICYRRDDTSAYSGWIYDRLVKHFRKENIYLDIQIDPGDDFVEQIRNNLDKCDILLVIIGQNWLLVRDKHDRRRIDDPGDFVRLEIIEALKRKITVIPILVDNAIMPSAEELPAELASLTRRQAFEIRHIRFDTDFNLLIDRLKNIINSNVNAPENGRRLSMMVIGVCAIVLVFLITWVARDDSTTNQSDKSMQQPVDTLRTLRTDTLHIVDTVHLTHINATALDKKVVTTSKKRKSPTSSADQQKKTTAEESVNVPTPLRNNGRTEGELPVRYWIAHEVSYYTYPHVDSVTSHNIGPGRNHTVTALHEKNGFILIDYYNRWGMKIKGWVQTKYLKKLE